MNPSTFVVTPSLFRALLFGSLVLGLVGAMIDVLVPGLVPEVLWQAQAEAAGEEIRLADYVLMVAGVVLLVAAVVSVYGLYMFRRWAPLFSLLVTVATVPLYPLTGVSVSSGWAVGFTEVSMMLWGAVLAFAYAGPIRDRFGGQGR
ncbi:MAG: hypothetical protein MZW92_46010 [Comamonadaceae bacterium]|nr:hypothetical protein [Comamonadaceae bacterium]